MVDGAQHKTLGEAIAPVLLILACVSLTQIFFSELTVINDNTALLMRLCLRMLGGSELYVNLFEVNAPQAVWLYMLPALLVDTYGLSLDYALRVFVGGLAIVVGHLYFVACGYRRGETGLFLLLAIVSPGYDFGDREPMMFLLSGPFIRFLVADLAGSEKPNWNFIFASFLAGIAFAIKPHYAAIFAIIITGYLLSAKIDWFRTIRVFALPSLTALGVWILFLALHVEFIEFTRSVTSVFYSALLRPIILMKLLITSGVVPLLAFLILLIRVFPTARQYFWRPEMRFLSLVILGMILVFLLQGRGATYHVFPAASWAALYCYLLLTGTSRHIGKFFKVTNGILFIALLASIYVARPIYALKASGHFRSDFLSDRTLVHVREQFKGQTVYYLGLSFNFPEPNGAYADILWQNRFHTLWALREVSVALNAEDDPNSHRARELKRVQKWAVSQALDALSIKPAYLICDVRNLKPIIENPCGIPNALFSNTKFRRLLTNYKPPYIRDGLLVYRRLN